MGAFNNQWTLPICATIFGIIALSPCIYRLLKKWRLKRKSKNTVSVIEKFLVTKVCSQDHSFRINIKKQSNYREKHSTLIFYCFCNFMTMTTFNWSSELFHTSMAIRTATSTRATTNLINQRLVMIQKQILTHLKATIKTSLQYAKYVQTHSLRMIK